MLFFALSVGVASPAAAVEFTANPTNGAASVKVKLSAEKNTRSLEIKDAKRIPLPDGNYVLLVTIVTGLPQISAGVVNLRHGEFKSVEFKKMTAGPLFKITFPGTATIALATLPAPATPIFTLGPARFTLTH